MPNQQTDILFQLIKSLTKAEKRNFKLFASRNQQGGDLKFVQLFDVLDKLNKFEEDVILKKLPQIKKQQLSNQKRHLYKQIMSSLRIIHIQKNIDIEIREYVDNARILYNKGLFLQSLRMLEKAKQLAKLHNQDILHLEIVEFEKMIESRHITRSIANRAEELSEESTKRVKVIKGVGQLTNLSLQLYGMYIKIGHVKNEKDAVIMSHFFQSRLQVTHPSNLTFFEKIHLCQAYVWYYYILQDFPLCYKYAQKWVDLFKANLSMIKHDVDLYIRGYNNLLSALFQLGYSSKLSTYLGELIAFEEANKHNFSENTKTLLFLYKNTTKFNQGFLEAQFPDADAWIPQLEKELQVKLHNRKIDQHRILIFYYKIGTYYFVIGDNERAIDYLNLIIQSKVGQLREDIQCYARMLHLIGHYELGHFELLEYLVKSVYRYLAKIEDLNAVQKEVLKFLRKALYMNPKELIPLFVNLKASLQKWVEHPYEKRSFLYLDIISWLESKIQDRPVQEVMREKYLKNRR